MGSVLPDAATFVNDALYGGTYPVIGEIWKAVLFVAGVIGFGAFLRAWRA